MNDGLFHLDVDIKLPDDDGGITTVTLNGGMLSAFSTHVFLDRGYRCIAGSGVFRIDGDVEGDDDDPRQWLASGALLPSPGYEEILIEYITAGAYTEVSAIPSDPNIASNSNPPDLTTLFETEFTLSWSSGQNASHHDVSFGSDFEEVNTAGDPNILPGRGRFDSNSHDVYDLEALTTYYWRINEVAISNAFYMSATEVTNSQYELFDPNHSIYRTTQTYNNGHTLTMSTGDDEAVIYVSWYDANNFCRWLSDLEGKPYRLATESEWEYACRAGTSTAYSTGTSLEPSYYKNQNHSSWPEEVDLTVKTTGHNSWGLWEMHGNAEEWCNDWYGPYEITTAVDPVGRANGDFRVTRGGSHNTTVFYLRSANRLSSLPADKHWLIGFRKVNTPGPVSTRQCPVISQARPFGFASRHRPRIFRCMAIIINLRSPSVTTEIF